MPDLTQLLDNSSGFVTTVLSFGALIVAYQIGNRALDFMIEKRRIDKLTEDNWRFKSRRS